MIGLPDSRRALARLLALCLAIGVLIYWIGFDTPRSILNPAHQSSVIKLAP